MDEKRYRVIEVTTGVTLASGMIFEVALAFISGYRMTFYEESLNLIIAEEESSTR